MERTFRKTIAFCLAVAIFIGIVNPSIAANASEKSQGDNYILNVIAQNEYSDGVRFGDGYLMLKDGKFNKITSKTTYTYIDANGNKKEIKNTVGFTEVFLNTSGNSYYVDYGVLAVGKNNKVALIDENGYLYGGKENFYSCVVYAGDGLFYTTNATANKEDKGDTEIWTLRKKDGTKVKEFTKLHLRNRAHANGYEYVMYEEGGVNKLIAVDGAGKIKEMGSGYSSFMANDNTSLIHEPDYNSEYVVAYKTDAETYMKKSVTVFSANGSKLFEINNCTSIDVNLLAKYGYAKVQLYRVKDSNYEYCENIVDIKGKLMLDSWKHDSIKSYDDKAALTFKDNGETLLVDYSKNIKFDAQKFAKQFGESYSSITFSSYYIDSTLTVTIEDQKSNSDIGTSFFFNNEGEKISGDIKGQIRDFDGTYSILYDKNTEKSGVVTKNADIIKKGYDEVYLERNRGGSQIVARGKNYGSEKTILLLKNKSEIDKYSEVGEFVNGHAIVKVNGSNKYGIIDINGTEIVKAGVYSDFVQFEDSECFVGYKAGYPYLFDTTGKVLTAEKSYKKIGTYESRFYKFSAGRNETEYESVIGANNVAITMNDKNKFGLIKVQKLTPVSSISLNKTTLSLIKGKSETLKATINPTNATNKNVLWESSNKNVATVDSKGVVKAVSKGSATITVKTVDGNKKASCNVTINEETPIQGDWKDHWAKREIKSAMEKGWVKSTDTFRPEDAITRAEFVKIVNKAFKFTTKATSEKYTDVNQNDWWYGEVLIAIKAGYIDTKATNFRPQDKITREEAAAIITTIKDNKDSNLDKSKKYEDFKKISSWAQTSVEGAIEAGYMGKGSNSFRPKDNITRAEAIVTLNRVVK